MMNRKLTHPRADRNVCREGSLATTDGNDGTITTKDAFESPWISAHLDDSEWERKIVRERGGGLKYDSNLRIFEAIDVNETRRYCENPLHNLHQGLQG